MQYATIDFYLGNYLLGRKPVLPLPEFSYWENKARRYIDDYTFKRITQDVLDGEFGEVIRECACELSEYLYVNEGREGKQSESISGRSVTYTIGTEYHVCRKYLGNTGLMYRGANK